MKITITNDKIEKYKNNWLVVVIIDIYREYVNMHVTVNMIQFYCKNKFILIIQARVKISSG